MLSYREIDRSEWHRIPQDALGNYSVEGRDMRIAVAEEFGQIVGVWCLTPVVHFEPVWVAPSHRGHPNLLKRLVALVKSIGRNWGCDILVAIVPDDNPGTQRIERYLNAETIPGHLVKVNTKE